MYVIDSILLEKKWLVSEPVTICSEWTERKDRFSNSSRVIVNSSILLVRLGKSNSTPGSCMFSFRVFELNKYAKDPKFTMLYTGNFVFDQEVEVSLNELVEENGTRFSLVYYDNTCDVYDGGAAEEAEEPGIGIMWLPIV